jgi:serine/threonine-protein kinase
MGEVWLAERADGVVGRQVALKLPAPTMRHRELAARFARERAILSRLTHPNIARMYDAGFAANGQPYLALEYVEGVPLTQNCDARGLGVDARIALFLQVLAAVEYAHDNLVIHRDLKPSNILVTPEGNVKLLDFGIAKLLANGSAEETDITRVGGHALTLDYAAPEQVTGAPLTTAVDVYALGVLLYELLTGARPYRVKRGSLEEIGDAIVSVDPVPPSRAVYADAALAARSTTGSRLCRALSGDLDTIVQKALRKSPSERYASAGALADDLSRHRAHLPVTVRPASAWYRFVLFVRRNILSGSGVPRRGE